MISQTAEYALRAIVHLAGCWNASPPQNNAGSQTVQQIAEATCVPAGYLSKVLQNLCRQKLIVSQRGLGGGFRLAKSPDAMSLYEVIQAVDPLQRIHRCPLGLPEHGTNLCLLHSKLDAAMALVEESFRTTMIADLLAAPATRSKRRLPCVFPVSLT